MKDYNSIPDEDRLPIEKQLAESGLSETDKEEVLRQINEVYWIAEANPHPLRLKWLSFRIRMGVYYQRVCRFFRLS